MRKISKLSLVAAVAVAGFTTANAQPLEEAIKNVEVSGSVVYRYDNFHSKEINGLGRSADSGKNNYKVGLNLASKVNDYVKFNSRFLVANEYHGGFVALDSKEGSADGQAAATLSNAYFALTAIPNTTVNIGKQGLATPWTKAMDINGNEQTGTGILALTTVGPVTAAAGYFNNTNLDKSTEINATKKWGAAGKDITQNTYELIDGGSDVYVATVHGDLDFVKLEAWYLGLADTFNTYTLVAKGNVDLAEDAKIGLEARYVDLKLNSDFEPDERKNSMFRLAADAKVSIVNARLAYTQTGKNGGLTALDQDAENTSLGWAITSNGVADAKFWQAAIGADILENLNFTLNYGNLKSKDTTKSLAIDLTNIKQQEVYGQLTYKMSKNLNTYLRYGKYTEKEYDSGDKTMDQNRGRVQVAYTF